MRAGDTCVYQGSEVALFPLDYINVTQIANPSSYSHCCGHMADYGFPYHPYPAYAPFSCTLFESSGSALGNRRSYVSDAPVWTASHGLTYVTVSFTHDLNPPTATHYNQGDLIYHSGDAGQAIGEHIHMDQSPIANASLITDGTVCPSGLCYHLASDDEAEAIFYLTGSENVVYTAGKNFTTWSGSPIIPGPGPGPGPGGGGNFKIWMAAKLLRRRKNGL